MKLYNYTNLATGQIRLLTLLPAKRSEEICITLQHHSLSSPSLKDSQRRYGTTRESCDGQYIALSYVWGDEKNPSAATVIAQGDRSSIPITQNLDIALRHLRRHDEERVFWIDAICINQADLAERSSQVTIMAHLYGRAKDVLIWLGPELDDGQHGLRLLNTWGQVLEVDWVTMRTTGLTEEHIENQQTVPPVGTRLSRRDSLAIYYLLKRSWFERLWTKQEVLNLASKFVMCGDYECPWESLAKAIVTLRYRRIMWDLPQPVATMYELFERRMAMVYGLCISFASTRTLENLRYDLHDLKYGEPRDTIYASLSMLTSSDQNIGIVPDYTISLNELFKDVVTRKIGKHRQLSILSSCRLACQRLPDLPSWIPDWSCPIKCGSIRVQWSASAWTSALVTIDGDALYTAAIPKANVKHIHNLEHKQVAQYPIIYTLMVDIWKLRPEDYSRAYIAGDDQLTAYTRTLSTDWFKERYEEDVSAPSLEEAKDFLRQLWDIQDESEIRASLQVHMPLSIVTWMHKVKDVADGRCLFITEQGFVGLAPSETLPGDRVFVILGCSLPLLLRPVSAGDERRWRVVGACYVDGLMNGEAIYGPLSAEYVPFERRIGRNQGNVHLKHKSGDILMLTIGQTLKHFGVAFSKHDQETRTVEVTLAMLKEQNIDIQMITLI